jgi:Fe-S-cluster-containing dehydrogenase component
MARYAMVVKTKLCTGCQTCAVACKMENLTLPGAARTTVTERVTAEWDVRQCMQCDAPPCVPVCPAKATAKNAAGITLVNQEACVGCGACVQACPYGARTMNGDKPFFGKPLPYEEAAKRTGEAHRIHQAGKADKCTFCEHRLAGGKPPMCVEACTTAARVFGDLDDRGSEAARLVAGGAKPFRPELGTRPKLFYL